MNAKQLRKEIRAKCPKTAARLDKRWDTKMTRDVLQFSVNIGKLIKFSDTSFTYDGMRIEEGLWKLLKKARRLK